MFSTFTSLKLPLPFDNALHFYLFINFFSFSDFSNGYHFILQQM